MDIKLIGDIVRIIIVSEILEADIFCYIPNRNILILITNCECYE